MGWAHSLCAELPSPPVASKPLSFSLSPHLSSFKAFDLSSRRFLKTKQNLPVCSYYELPAEEETNTTRFQQIARVWYPRKRHQELFFAQSPSFTNKCRDIAHTRRAVLLVSNKETGGEAPSFTYEAWGVIVIELFIYEMVKERWLSKDSSQRYLMRMANAHWHEWRDWAPPYIMELMIWYLSFYISKTFLPKKILEVTALVITNTLHWNGENCIFPLIVL